MSACTPALPVASAASLAASSTRTTRHATRGRVARLASCSAQAQGAAESEKVARRAILSAGLLVAAAPAISSSSAFAASDMAFKEQVVCDAGCQSTLDGIPMIETSSGLKYQDIKKGRGPSPPTGYQVTVHYTALTPSGQVFASSYESGKPYDVRVGAGQIVKGLDEGLLTMQVGGIRRIYIPGELAFPKGLASAPGRPRIPPNSPCIFDVNLLYIPGLDFDEVDNPHRVDVTLLGSKSLAAEEEAARAAKLAEVAATMEPGGAAAEKMVAATQALSTWQEGPDPDWAAATIPQLTLADVSIAVQWTPSTTESLYGCQLIKVEQPTSGLLYAKLALELSGSVEPSEVATLPMLAYALGELGYAGRSAAERAAHEGARTGGLEFSLHTSQREGSGAGEDDIAFYLLVEGVAQVRNADALLSAMADALTHLEWESSESESIMRRFASRALADLEGDFEENTLKWASVHSAAMLTPAGWVRDQMEGLPQAAYLRDCIGRLAAGDGWRDVKRDLTALLSRIRYQFGTVLGLTGDATALAAAAAPADGLLQRLQPLGASDGSTPPPLRHAAAVWNITAEAGNHALLAEEKNNHISSPARLRNPLPGCAYAAAALLDNYLNLKVREERGAYGAYANLDSAAATFELSSYRDPGLGTTIATFAGVPRWLADHAASLRPRDLTNAVLGGVRDMEPHRSPAQAGREAMLAYLNRASVAGRQYAKDALLGCTSKGIGEFAAELDSARFFTTAAAREVQAERVQRGDGLPFFDEFISVDNYFSTL